MPLGTRVAVVSVTALWPSAGFKNALHVGLGSRSPT